MKIYDAITGISDNMLEEAQTFTFKKSKLGSQKRLWKKYIPWVAGLTLTLSVGIVLWQTNNTSHHSMSGGGGSEEMMSQFYYYTGPIFPLTVLEEDDAISVVREIDFDFSPYLPQYEVTILDDGTEHIQNLAEKESIVTDLYTITNWSDQEKNLRFYYPITNTLNGEVKYLPQILVNGEEVETTLKLGNSEAYEKENIPTPFFPRSVEDYKEFLQNGHLFLPETELSLDIPVTVYRFTEHTADFTQGINPTLALSCTLDQEKTALLSYGFHGFQRNDETNEQIFSYSIPQVDESGYHKTRYLIILGDDVDFTLQGYETTAYDPKEKIDSPSATIIKEKTDLATILSEILFQEDAFPLTTDSILSTCSQDEILQLVGNFLDNYLVFQTDEDNLYQPLWLEFIISDILNQNRIFYAEFDLNLSENTTIEISATARKEASSNPYTKGSTLSADGFDLLTTFASNLQFSRIIATIQTHDIVDVVADNFNFDLSHGITSVDLEPNIPHYFLHVAMAVIEE